MYIANRYKALLCYSSRKIAECVLILNFLFQLQAAIFSKHSTFATSQLSNIIQCQVLCYSACLLISVSCGNQYLINLA
jgi:hypothetical protein